MNAVPMRLRKTKPARSLTQTGLEGMEVTNLTSSPDRESVNSELMEKLKEGIKQLDPDLRAAVILKGVQGLPQL